MTTFVTILLVLAMAGVLIVLLFGIATMLRGGNPRRSNKLMQARVVMQGLETVKNPKTEVESPFHNIEVWQFNKAGKITGVHFYFDTKAVSDALGL